MDIDPENPKKRKKPKGADFDEGSVERGRRRGQKLHMDSSIREGGLLGSELFEIDPNELPRARPEYLKEKDVRDTKKYTADDFPTHKLKEFPINLSKKLIIKRYFEEAQTKQYRSKEESFWALVWDFLISVKHHGFWKNSLAEIEARAGTSVANVFYFIRWAFFLNVMMAFFCISFFVIPYFIGFPPGHDEDLNDGGKLSPSQYNDKCTNKTNSNFTSFLEEDKALLDHIGCCSYDLKTASQDSGFAVNFGFCVLGLHKFTKDEEGNNNKTEIKKTEFKNTLFSYGYYNAKQKDTKNFIPLLYLLAPGLIFIITIISMIITVGNGIEELVTHSHGQIYVFSSLVFMGWDHRTDSQEVAAFRRKVLLNEMSVMMETEQIRQEHENRSKQEKTEIWFLRIMVNLIVVLLIIGFGWSLLALAGLIENFRTSYPHGGLSFNILFILIQFTPSLYMNIANIVIPKILNMLGKLEKMMPHSHIWFLMIRAVLFRIVCILFTLGEKFVGGFCRLVDESCNDCESQYLDFLRLGKREEGQKRSFCWETVVSCQLYKNLFIDLIIKIFMTFVVDKIRVLLADKYPENKVMRYIGTITFNYVRHGLDTIHLQTIALIGVYFSPLYPIFTSLALVVFFYIKKYQIIYNCKAMPETYRVMRTTAVFMGAKLLSFVFAILIMTLVISFLRPSKECGPFRYFETPWKVVNETFSASNSTKKIYDHLDSPCYYIPILALMIILCFYFHAQGRNYRERVNNLRELLIQEGQDKEYIAQRLKGIRKREGAFTKKGGKRKHHPKPGPAAGGGFPIKPKRQKKYHLVRRRRKKASDEDNQNTRSERGHHRHRGGHRPDRHRKPHTRRGSPSPSTTSQSSRASTKSNRPSRVHSTAGGKRPSRTPSTRSHASTKTV